MAQCYTPRQTVGHDLEMRHAHRQISFEKDSDRHGHDVPAPARTSVRVRSVRPQQKTAWWRETRQDRRCGRERGTIRRHWRSPQSGPQDIAQAWEAARWDPGGCVVSTPAGGPVYSPQGEAVAQARRALLSRPLCVHSGPALPLCSLSPCPALPDQCE